MSSTFVCLHFIPLQCLSCDLSPNYNILHKHHLSVQPRIFLFYLNM